MQQQQQHACGMHRNFQLYVINMEGQMKAGAFGDDDEHSPV
jgi:hypothetical protein